MSAKKYRREVQETQRARKVVETMTVKAAELVLVRHGETDWNREHRLQGQMQPGPPLNAQGWRQCEMLLNVLQERFTHFAAIVSSDLLRTLQTAEVVAAAYQLEVQQHHGLRERNLGILQGLTYAEAPAAQPEAWAALQSRSSSMRIPGGGESLDDLQQRMAASLLDIAAQYPGKRVLIVSHGGALHAAHRAARGYTASGKVFNCGISIVMAEPCSQAEQHQQLQQQALPHQLLCSMQQQQQQPMQAQAMLLPASCTATDSSCSASSFNKGLCKHSSIALQVSCRNESSTGVVSYSCNSATGSSSNGPSTCASSSMCCTAMVDGSAGISVYHGVHTGRLAMLSWNDGHELVAQGMLDESGFGGSSKEA